MESFRNESLMKWYLPGLFGTPVLDYEEKSVTVSKELQDMAELLEEGQEETETVQTISENSYVMLSDNRIFGSSGMLATEILRGFAERRNDDFYILPCSVHELILVPVSTNVSPDYLREVVQEVNEESVLPEERLSDAVYYFSRESGVVQVAGE